MGPPADEAVKETRVDERPEPRGQPGRDRRLATCGAAAAGGAGGPGDAAWGARRRVARQSSSGLGAESQTTVGGARERAEDRSSPEDDGDAATRRAQVDAGAVPTNPPRTASEDPN